MGIKTIFNYSPNFNYKKRNSQQIKFIIFHYTGMKNDSLAIKRLTDMQSEVSSHYLIKNNGEIVVLVPDLYIAWHAGASLWKNFKSLNKNSIGIEISNPGHGYEYKNFAWGCTLKEPRQLKDYNEDEKFMHSISDTMKLNDKDYFQAFELYQMSNQFKFIDGNDNIASAPVGNTGRFSFSPDLHNDCATCEIVGL